MSAAKNEEEYLHEILNILQAQYEEARRPYIERLMQIKNAQVSHPIAITLQQAETLGIIKKLAKIKPL